MPGERVTRSNALLSRRFGPELKAQPHRYRWLSRRHAVYVTGAIAAFLALLCFPLRAEQSLSPQAKQGFAIVQAYCARCHAVERLGESSLPAAPRFRALHEQYPVESLEESLAEGIVTGHPDMPESRFDPGQVGDVIAYLKSLER
jgi:mono/diheme cytochrome c family protein